MRRASNGGAVFVPVGRSLPPGRPGSLTVQRFRFYRVREPSKYGTRALRWNRTNDLPVMSRVLWPTELAMRLSDADAERLSLS